MILQIQTILHQVYTIQALASTLHVCKQGASVSSDLNSVHPPICGHLDMHESGRRTVGEMDGHVGQDLCNVHTSNLSQLCVCPQGEGSGGITGLDPDGSCSLPNYRSQNNRVRKHSTHPDVQTGCTQPEDMDSFALGFQLTSAGFESVQPSSVHTSVYDFTHPFSVKTLHQLGSDFGCIPLGDFKLYIGPPVTWQLVPDIIQAHNLIRDSGVPNLWGQRIPVKSDLNIPGWREHLCDYFDQQLVDLIQYGSPLDFDSNLDLFSTFNNHASAVEFAAHVDQYIRKNYSMELSWVLWVIPLLTYISPLS